MSKPETVFRARFEAHMFALAKKKGVGLIAEKHANPYRKGEFDCSYVCNTSGGITHHVEYKVIPHPIRTVRASTSFCAETFLRTSESWNGQRNWGQTRASFGVPCHIVVAWIAPERRFRNNETHNMVFRFRLSADKETTAKVLETSGYFERYSEPVKDAAEHLLEHIGWIQSYTDL